MSKLQIWSKCLRFDLNFLKNMLKIPEYWICLTFSINHFITVFTSNLCLRLEKNILKVDDDLISDSFNYRILNN